MEAPDAVGHARALLRSRDFPSARAACVDILQADPANAEALLIHGLACAELGEFQAAAASLERSLAAAPQPAMVAVILADVLLQAGDAAAAESAAREALRTAPVLSDAHNVLGVALHRQQRVAEACAAYRAAIACESGNATAWRNLSAALAALDDLPGAVEACLTAMKLAPGRGADDAATLGVLLHRQARVVEAIETLRAAVAQDASRVDAWLELANCHADLAEHGEARGCYERALALRPAFHEVESTLLVNLHYDPGFDAQQMFEAHRAWARRHAASIAPRVHSKPRREGRLRVAFMSPAFRAGPPGYFARSLFEALDRARFEMWAYNANGRRDGFTDELQSTVDHWRDAWGDDDDAFAQRILDDGIDILVDCAGHTPGGRPLLLARKPAPVQVTWLDYFDTTGLDAVDWLIGDAVATPQNGPQRFSEGVLRLGSCRLCYRPPAYAPAVKELPALSNARVTFGSFNRMSKIVPAVVELWSELLAAAPASRLVLKNAAMNDGRAREVLLRRFEAAGVNPARIELRPHCAHAAMLDEYNDVDVALDTFPYNGGLTSCEALWMGVPVLCLLGDSMISRQTASIMTAAGLPEWIARTPRGYVELGVAAAGERSRLSRLRAAMRRHLSASELMDAASHGRRFGELLLGAWSQRARG